MNIIIDNREKDLIELCSKNNLEFNKQNLHLGDITFNLENNQELIIIERKTIDDLLQSINDGRYREQKSRLLEKHKKDGTSIYYLLEGNIYNSSKSDLIYSCIINTMIRDNFKIIYSKNIEETYNYIIKITKKCVEFKGILTKNEIINNNYIDVIKSEKKKNMTKENCYMAMLKQIPGVSSNIAINISKEYDSFNKLIKAYEVVENNKELLLKDIVIGKRKLGNVLSKRIYDYLN